VTWTAAPAGVPEKLRRFAAGAPVPVPAGATPTAAEQSLLYFTGTLAADQQSFAIPKTAAPNYDRYNKVQISCLETLEVIKGAAKKGPGAGAPPPGAAKTFQITPGQTDASNYINQFWVFPANSNEIITSATIADVQGSDTNILDWPLIIFPPGYVDPWGNTRSNGGVFGFLIYTNGGLSGTNLLEFNYQTTTGAALSAWDFVYNDQSDPSGNSLSVQAYGGKAGYDLPVYQPVSQCDGPILAIISGTAISGTNLTLSGLTVSFGTNSAVGQEYRLVSSPDLTVPIANWTPIYTNVFSWTNFSITIPMVPGAPQQFYQIVVP
jgi:hypothetical protein